MTDFDLRGKRVLIHEDLNAPVQARRTATRVFVRRCHDQHYRNAGARAGHVASRPS
jgi:hypothetical protein